MKELFNSNEILNELEIAKKDRRPWIGKGAIANISEYFSITELETLIAQTSIWTPETLQVFLDTNAIPPNELFFPQQASQGTKPALNAQKLKDALNLGSSIILNDISGLSTGVMKIREALADKTNGKLECNLYYSQKNHQAFSVHYDVHDVFAIQVTGKKHWQVFDKSVEYPINHPQFTAKRHMNPKEIQSHPILDFVFEPGDIVYIPSGFLHHAACREGHSLHLSFGLVEMIGLDVISIAFEHAVKEDFFRTPLKTILRDKRALEPYLLKWAKQIKNLSNDKNFKKQIELSLDNFRYPAEKVQFGAKEED